MIFFTDMKNHITISVNDFEFPRNQILVAMYVSCKTISLIHLACAEPDMTAPAKIFKSETRRDIKVIETSFVHL